MACRIGMRWGPGRWTVRTTFRGTAWGMAGLLALGGCSPAGKHPGAPGMVECLDRNGSLVVRAAGKDVIRYNYAAVPPPEGADPVYARSGYIHPVWTPDGRVISNDFPGNHLHHHGIWAPWTSTEFEGRQVDFWNMGKGEGRVEFVKLEGTFSGAERGGFSARHRFVDLTARGGEKAALRETWVVTVKPSADPFIFDLVSTQTCATDASLKLLKYRYGGMGFRGSGEWEGAAGVEFLTSEGKTREDGHATRAKWCIMTGQVEGRGASIAFLCHPKNFRFPQPMRIHPDEPFFNFAPCQAGDFEIKPGDEYVARYRYVVSNRRLTAEEVEGYWEEYAGE